MGERWAYEKQERNDNGYGDIYIGDSRAYRHDDYVRMHNADCDAYEKRIAELEAIIAPPDGANKWIPDGARWLGDTASHVLCHRPARALQEAGGLGMSDSETRGWKRDQYGYYTKSIDGVEYCLWKTSGFIEAWVVRAGGEIIHHPRSKKGDYITRLDAAKRAAHAHARETK